MSIGDNLSSAILSTKSTSSWLMKLDSNEDSLIAVNISQISSISGMLGKYVINSSLLRDNNAFLALVPLTASPPVVICLVSRLEYFPLLRDLVRCSISLTSPSSPSRAPSIQ